MFPSLPRIRLGIVFGVMVTALLATGCAPAAPATATSSHGLQGTRGELAEHDNSHRPHRSLGQRAPSAPDTTPTFTGDVDLAMLGRADRLGGLIHEYRLVA